MDHDKLIKYWNEMKQLWKLNLILGIIKKGIENYFYNNMLLQKYKGQTAAFQNGFCNIGKKQKKSSHIQMYLRSRVISSEFKEKYE